eukprot:CAMPEP_0116839986 /NCGR_PEP_ID=MMETSP0418-20121206/10078_1 /TAXON_ID=1158023 /ORGANISM="Astrosyne radiata, Strain 13vi08-1A" /LENGTH=104 /DNA_ID=CAMNT_0004470171 /DNA_START=107 /DNA_END=418 /DNA_ORIENTATION=-
MSKRQTFSTMMFLLAVYTVVAQSSAFSSPTLSKKTHRLSALSAVSIFPSQSEFAKNIGHSTTSASPWYSDRIKVNPTARKIVYKDDPIDYTFESPAHDWSNADW